MKIQPSGQIVRWWLLKSLCHDSRMLAKHRESYFARNSTSIPSVSMLCRTRSKPNDQP